MSPKPPTLPALRIRNVQLVEKSNTGLNVLLRRGHSPVVPETGDAFQLLKDDGSGEYREFHVAARIFREVPDAPEGRALFDVVAVVIQRPVQWQP